MIDVKKIHLNLTIQHFLLKFICWYILVIFMFFIPNEINHFPTFSQQPNRKKEKNQNLNFVKEISKNSHSKSSYGARGKIKEEKEEEENEKEEG